MIFAFLSFFFSFFVDKGKGKGKQRKRLRFSSRYTTATTTTAKRSSKKNQRDAKMEDEVMDTEEQREDYPEEREEMQEEEDEEMQEEDDDQEEEDVRRAVFGGRGGGGSGSMSQRFADNALQGLLKKLGAGLEDLLPTSGGSGGGSGSGGSHHGGLFSGHEGLFGGGSSLSHRLKPILLGLKRYDDEQKQLGALTELCDILTVSSEEALISCFSCEAFIPPLVELLRCEHNPDVALFAGRALTTLADLMPPRTAVSSMLKLGAADAFCVKLMCVEYIDVAEQSLQAMEKISSAGKEHAAVCMRAGGVQAVLSFLDFFQTGVQRVAVKTASNMLACVSSKQDVTMIKDALPILVNLLSYGDDKIVEHAFLGLTRALSGMCLCMNGFRKTDSMVDEYVSTILSTKMLDEMSKLLQVSESGSMHSSLSSSSYYEAVGSLAKCCNQSALVAERLLDLDVPVICRRLLQSFSMSSSAATTPSATRGTSTPTGATVSPMVSPSIRSSENTLSILKLVDVMLPTIPENLRSLGAESKQLAFSSPVSHPINDDTRESAEAASSFRGILERRPDVVEQKASRVLLPTLFGMMSSTLAYQLKQICMSCMKKLLVHSSPDGLKDMLRDLPASSTVMGLLASKDCSVQMDAIFMASVLLDKLPDIFVPYFMKEGVVFSINHIAEQPCNATSNSPTDGDSMMEEASKASTSKRERRRSRSKSNPGAEGFVTPKRDLQASVVQTAIEFQARYAKISAEYGINSEALPAEMEALQKLAQQIENGDASALSSILDKVVTATGGISSFELVHSGLEKALLAYFTVAGADMSYKQASDFAEVCSNRSNSEEVFKILLKRLHEIVSSRETLPVVACPARPAPSATMRYLFFERSQSGSRSKEANGLAALAHPFKLHFARAEDEKDLRDYSSNVVLVEPLSTFEVIEDFLRTRVAMSHTSSSKARTRSSTSSILTRSKSKQKQEEEEGLKASKEASTSRRVTRSSAKQASQDASMEEDERNAGKGQKVEEDDMNGSSDMSDMDDDDLDVDEEGDHDMLDDDMDDEDEENFENPFRFRRESEVFEVDVGESEDKADESKGGNYAEKAAKKRFGLQFFLNGKPMNSKTSVFQAVLQANNAFVNADDPQSAQNGCPRVWDKVHTFTYRKQALKSDDSEQKPKQTAQAKSRVVSVKDLVKEKVLCQNGAVEQLDEEIVSVLNLINILIWLKGEHSRAYKTSRNFAFLDNVPKEDLVSFRLTSKVLRQLQDLLIICGKCLPSWVHHIVKNYPLVFPFDLRRQYFHLTSLGVAHAIQYLLQQIPNGDSLRQELRDVRLVRNRRQKVRIHREKLLESACKVMNLYGKSQASLEIEYFGEVGTGLGPTLEFYTLLSSELQKKHLDMWLSKKEDPVVHQESNDEIGMSENIPIDSESDGLIFGDMDSVSKPEVKEKIPEKTRDVAVKRPSEYVLPLGEGLYPIPKLKVGKKELAHFKLLGTTFAKALYDGRLLDIPLATAFWRRALGQNLTVYDLACVDTQMSKSLIQLHEVANSKDPTKIEGMPIEDLELYFTLPGHEDYELCEGGSEIPVTGKNLGEFIDKVLDAYFGAGTEKQFMKFREGFEDVFPLATLAIFKTDEIDVLVCGQTEKWTVEMLSECLKFDHGYTASSPYIKQFLHILADFTPDEQRQFLKFVTGAPRLPPGGLNALNPRLTIVRKNFSSARDSAGNTPRSESMHTPMNELVLENYDLPSVMTCANYVKLPPYTSQAVMKEKLLYAMREGQHSFNLS